MRYNVSSSIRTAKIKRIKVVLRDAYTNPNLPEKCIQYCSVSINSALKSIPTLIFAQLDKYLMSIASVDITIFPDTSVSVVLR